MNKNKLYLILFSLSILIGCKDAIDIDQPGRLNDEAAFESVADLKTGLYWLYDGLDASQYIAFSAVYTDEVAVGKDNGGQALSNLNFVLTPASAASAAFWTGNYASINAANRIIEASAVVPVSSEEQAEFDAIIAHAKAVRGLCHLVLLQMYTPASDYTNDSAFGIPVMESVPKVDAQPRRNTVGETFAAILSDFNAAIPNIDNISLAGDANSYLTADALTGYKAIVAAHTQNYSEAFALSQELVNKYPLADVATYPSIFDDTSDAEVIFKLERTIGDSYDGQGSMGSVYAGGWAGARFCFSAADGDPYLEVSRSLYNQLDANDVRTSVVVHPNSIIDADYQNSTDYRNTDVVYVGKYIGSEGQALMNDLKVMRTPAMYYIHAEAQASLGDLAGAAATLKALKDTRYGGDSGAVSFSSASDAMAFIVNDSRIEFAFEGARWFTLKRLGPSAGIDAVKDAKDCELSGGAECSLSSSDYRFTLPIPIVEFEGNPGLREQQNPGY